MKTVKEFKDRFEFVIYVIEEEKKKRRKMLKGLELRKVFLTEEKAKKMKSDLEYEINKERKKRLEGVFNSSLVKVEIEGKVRGIKILTINFDTLIVTFNRGRNGTLRYTASLEELKEIKD